MAEYATPDALAAEVHRLRRALDAAHDVVHAAEAEYDDWNGHNPASAIHRTLHRAVAEYRKTLDVSDHKDPQ